MKQRLRGMLGRMVPERLKERLRRRRRAKAGDRYTWMLEPFDRMCGGLAGKRVLEVGTDADCAMLHALIEDYRVREAVGINPAQPSKQLSGRARREPRDARDTGLPPEGFDIVLSCATFEHVHNLDLALAELYRVTRPGGMLLATAGPIWSSAWGHHLHCVVDGEKLEFARDTFIPPWGHLVLDRSELAEILTDRIGVKRARAVADYVADTPEQNRLFRADYHRLAEQSPWPDCYVFDQVNMEMLGRYGSGDLFAWHRRVRERYPEHSGFEVSDIGMVLRR